MGNKKGKASELGGKERLESQRAVMKNWGLHQLGT